MLNSLYLAVSFLAVFVSLYIAFMPSKNFNVAGKFCYVTGGTQGLGRSLAELLVRRGATVVIVSRNKARGDAVADELRPLAHAGQQVLSISADLSSATASQDALDSAVKQIGRLPEWTFLCAGFSKPELFVEAGVEDIQSGIEGVYYVAAWTAHAVFTRLVRASQPGKLVFVSSFAGLTSFAGYATYAPAKYAIRGLSDTLRSEGLLHGIDVHIYLPAGMATPGYETEMQTKHAVTRKIEEGDTLISGDKAAAFLVKGLEKGHYAITNDLVTDLIRVSAAGAVPGNGPQDILYRLVAAIGVPAWRMFTDHTIRSMRRVTETDLRAKGLID
ncbi:3-dehydrosphinganine reductase [Cryptotrichosporon argae]